ncbi:MAG: ribonuclease P protein component [Clostridia bacterium]|nr:ribonuclease P protein component [Clostridia bacterium]
MKFTKSLKENYEFRRLYAKGKTAALPCIAVYCRRRRGEENRLGFTVGKKIGNAVVRNRTRRRLREVYRLHEDQLVQGCDIVIVARTRAAFSSYRQLDESFVKLADKLGLLKKEGSK